MSGEPVYEFVEGVTSDLSFVARGASLEAVFAAAAEALLDASVEEPAALRARAVRTVRLCEPDLELLLLAFLNELIYLRDAKGLLLRARKLRVSPSRDGGAQLEGELAGEGFDPARHRLGTDVKAATAHGLRLVREGEGWRADVTLDV